MSLSDTIFARASGAGQAAVAVIRMSGPASGAILAQLAGPLPPARHASLRRLRAPGDGAVLDEALVLWFPGPRSYTGEDSAELQVHGGNAVVAAVSAALVALGCRPAEAGEFTRRAFLHERLDLVQAEAVADLIAAETEAQRHQALRQADGVLSGLYGTWTTELTRILAQQEAAIEFEDEDLPSDLSERARRAAGVLSTAIEAHLADSRGERLRNGLSVAIVGAPNAGKSSLLNALSGRDAAIVTPIAGTTRDIIECRLVLGGVPVTLADTAGLRDSIEPIEREGMRRAIARAETADLLIAAFAADQEPDADTVALVDRAQEVLVVSTKCDLVMPPQHIAGQMTLRTSCVSDPGISEVRDELEQRVRQLAGLSDGPALTRGRHRAALGDAAARLREAMSAQLPEVSAEGYRAALQELGRLTGKVGVEAVLDALFRDFCIGK